jgi:hypothetical protein
MNPTNAHVTISGLENSQQFVPVQSGTGVLVSSGSVRVTGAGTGATLIEVRTLSGRTVEAPTYFESTR